MASPEDKEKGPGKPEFTLEPFFGGYHKRLIFNDFDLSAGRWVPTEHVWRDFAQVPIEEETIRVLRGNVRAGKPLALPLPYGFEPLPESLSIEGTFKLDQNDALYLHSSEDGKTPFTVRVGRRKLWPRLNAPESKQAIGTHEEVDEIRAKIDELMKSGVQSTKMARELVKFVRSHLEYIIPSKELWQSYLKEGNNFFNRVWDNKKAHCFIANTEAVVEALRSAGVRARFVGGYYCKEKDDKGRAALGGSNGHAWLEIWDEYSQNWIRLDATPAGDPNVDQEAQEQDLAGDEESDNGEGDWGELASEEDVKKELKERKQKEGTGGAMRNMAELYDKSEDEFAKEAGCTHGEARDFLKALDDIRKINNEHGECLSDKMVEEWQKIIEERKDDKVVYKGPVRMDEGVKLVDPVSAIIDIRAGEHNPTGFEKEYTVQKKTTLFGGMDIYLSVDLSGSMGEADVTTGRPKCAVQRDVVMLVLDSIMRCASVSHRENESDDVSLPIKIMLTLARGSGSVGLPLTDKWGPKEQWAIWQTLNKYASGGTPTHETLALIAEGHKKEMLVIKKKDVTESEQPLHYAIELSDGAPDNMGKVIAWRDKLRADNVVVRPIQIGEGGITSFSQLPSILQEDIVSEFRKLRPIIKA